MFKRFLILVTAFLCLWLPSSCRREISALDFMTGFVAAYPIEGVVYHSSAEYMEEGYISEELFRRIYSYKGEMPEDFAIYLNSRPERGGECGIFKLGVGGDKEAVLEFCLNRIRLLTERAGDGCVLTSGDYVFYSTLSDTERAKELFYRLIK